MQPTPGQDRLGRTNNDNIPYGRPVGGGPTPPTIPPGWWKVIIPLVLLFGVVPGGIGVVKAIGRLDLPFISASDAQPAPEKLPGTVSVTDMAVGDCFELASPHDVTIVRPSSCAAEHFGQVLVRTELGPGPYTSMRHGPTSGCSTSWPAPALQRLRAGEIRENNRIPSAKDWAAGDRTVVCTAVIEDYDRPLNGSLMS